MDKAGFHNHDSIKNNSYQVLLRIRSQYIVFSEYCKNQGLALLMYCEDPSSIRLFFPMVPT
jgi:hypothetical protein